MHKITSLFSVGLAALAVQSVTAGIVITPVNSNEGSTLVTTILGSGVTTSNISYVGQNGQAGTFTGGTSAGLGFNSGIVLTTGFANMLPNPQASEYYYISGQQREFGFPIVPGDTDLENLVAPSIPEWWGPIPSYDANSLTFDFSFTGGGGGNLGFTYIFGSDEYPEYVGSFYNDAFAIFLNGNNIATLPGTSIAVAINNVNAGYADG